MKFNIFGVFRKMNYFGGSGPLQKWAILGINLCIFGYLLKVKVQNGHVFEGLLKFQMFLGVCLNS